MYFSNGTEGEMFQERNCFQCLHWKDNADHEEVCQVWFAHELFSGDKSKRRVLDMLIPDGDPTVVRCKMFVEQAPCSEFRVHDESELIPLELL